MIPEPYKHCEYCSEIIPWPYNRKRQRWVKQKKYETRKYCSKECSYLDRMPMPTEPTIPFWHSMAHIHFERFDDLQECPKCHGISFKVERIGKTCWNCGSLWFIREGNWMSEKSRKPENSTWDEMIAVILDLDNNNLEAFDGT